MNNINLTCRETLIGSLPHGGLVAEIGVQYGAFSTKILELNQPELLYLVDCWCHNYADPVTNFYNHEDAWVNINKHFAGEKRVAFIRELSVTASKRFEPSSLDIVYIDANHMTAAEDIEVWWPKVKPGGWMTGHDYFLKAGEVSVKWDVDAFVEQYWLDLYVTNDPPYPSWAIQKPSDWDQPIVGQINA